MLWPMVPLARLLTDHALDKITGRDCKLFNVFDRNRRVCRERMPELKLLLRYELFQKSKNLEQTGQIGPVDQHCHMAHPT
jgi:hypothetical protein